MSKRENKFIFVRQKKNDPASGDEGNFGLGRPFYFDDRFNRLAMMGTLISTIILLTFRQVTHSGTGSVLLDGVAYAAGFFFAYLIAEEADPDPDRRWGAILSAFLTLFAEAWLGVDPNGIVALLWVLFVMRMFNRTSGSRHHIGDNVLILCAAFYLGMQGFWLFPIVTGVVYIIESQLKEGYYRSLYIGALAFCEVIFTGRNFAPVNLDMGFAILMFAAFVLFIPEVMVAGISNGRDDRHHEPLIKVRVQSAQAFLVLGGDLLIWFSGNEGARMLLPCLTVSIGTGLYLVWDLARRKRIEKQVERFREQKTQKTGQDADAGSVKK